MTREVTHVKSLPLHDCFWDYVLWENQLSSREDVPDSHTNVTVYQFIILQATLIDIVITCYTLTKTNELSWTHVRTAAVQSNTFFVKQLGKPCPFPMWEMPR